MSEAIVQRFYMCRDKNPSLGFLTFSVVSEKICVVFAPSQKNQNQKIPEQKAQTNTCAGLLNKEEIFKKMHERIKMVK